MSNVKLKSYKTGKEVVMSEKEAEAHMALHGRKFSNLGKATDFEPEEAAAPATGRKRALPQGGPVIENEAPAA